MLVFKQILFGPMVVTLDDSAFVRGMEGGLESFFQEMQREPKNVVSSDEIQRMLAETMIDEAQPEREDGSVSVATRAGFAFGRLCALLHPDLDGMDPSLSWVEALIAMSSFEVAPNCLC